MIGNDFEQACSSFLNRQEYDMAENALSSMVRISFLVKWEAAGGVPPQPQKMFQLMRKGDINENRIETDTLPLTSKRQ